MALIKIISKDKVRLFENLLDVSDTDFNTSTPNLKRLKKSYVCVCVDENQIDVTNLSNPILSHRMLVSINGSNLDFKPYTDRYFTIPGQVINQVESLSIKETKAEGFKSGFLLKFNSIGDKIAFGVKPNGWMLEKDWREKVLPKDPDYVKPEENPIITE